jgi:alcohol dehydrogenase (NADP+)
MGEVVGYAARSAESPLSPLTFQRREIGPADIEVDILYCGICHTDLHFARNEWGNTQYPVVPGHEIVGRVRRAGAEVSRFKTGDLVGIGCMVDSCRNCRGCDQGLEQFCEQGPTLTYNAPEPQTGGWTMGGFSRSIVVDQHFVLRVPDTLDPAAAAPLLCAGITTFSPLRHFGAGPGRKVGVVGLGGLGHMAIKYAKAMGARVVQFTTSSGKMADATDLGADAVVLSTDPAQMAEHANSFDLILDTVAVPHDLDAYVELLQRDGTLVLIGLPPAPHPAPNPANLIFRRKAIAGSLIGGIAETQEMLEFSAEHGITADVEVIPIQEVNTAFERMLASDVKYRFVIDMASLDDSADGG